MVKCDNQYHIHVQSNAVIKWSSITWYFKHHCSDQRIINQTFDSQTTLHISHSRVSYGMSIVGILEKIDGVFFLENI